jgi:eukaryotic-like serine/threonine-protein kinase
MIDLRFWKKAGVGLADRVDSDVPKKMLGMFEVKGELGRGSMGVVYLGRDPASGRDVAIKTMTLSSEFNANALEDPKSRFLREAKILTWLDHPDIVTIYDVGEDNGLAYIAMEFLKGVELAEYTHIDKLLPLPKVLEIMARAADALGYAHEQDVVHRDVKPGNIGISRLQNFSSTRTGVVLGTPLYMSPEQVRGKAITGVSDLFSLGSTLYQMVCGQVPFKGDTELAVMHHIVHEPHADITRTMPHLPSAICAVIDCALEKDPKSRFQTGAEMAEAIRQSIKAL